VGLPLGELKEIATQTNAVPAARKRINFKNEVSIITDKEMQMRQYVNTATLG
jgi:hypothetical protein